MVNNMLKCMSKKDCSVKDLLCILCDYDSYICKEGDFNAILSFVKKTKGKALILLIQGKVSEKKAKEYAFILSEISKIKKVVWAANGIKKLSFKVLIAS